VHVLALNSGSSSLKFGLYRVSSADCVCLISGEAEGTGNASTVFHAEDAHGHTLLHETSALADPQAAVARIASLLADSHMAMPQAIGHRIVHGGPGLRKHCLIDASVLCELEKAAGFAPLHTPAALAVIRYAMAHFPGRPQVACLDTCFHADMPRVSSTLALPRELRAAGILRYGFHGLSCESIVHLLADTLPERLVIAHLGNGASITAVRHGVSIDTTMGLTPTGGLIMGSRSGDLDPGVLVYLMREKKLDAPTLENMLNHRSGLLGISGLSSDMRTLHAAPDTQQDAGLAIDMFCYVTAKYVGAMGVALGGLDLLVLTGGIGENDARVRAEICTRLAFLGVELDAPRNQRGRGLISSDASRCAVQVLVSQEDAQIARHTYRLSNPHN
jgi:acetate kinase